MTWFIWSPSYNTGIKSIDRQHMQLVEMVNRLYEAMHGGEGRHILKTTLDELLAYTKSHFADEERVMIMHQYPDLMIHRQKHRKMTDKVLELAGQMEQGEISSPVQIANFLKAWLEKHIMGTDKLLADFLKEKGVD